MAPFKGEKLYKPNFVLKIFLIFCLCVISLKCEYKGNQTGIVLIVNQNLISEAKNKLLPPLIEKIKNVSIDEQTFDLDVLIGNVHITLSNIKLNLENLQADFFNISLKEPNKTEIELSDLLGGAEGHFDLQIALFNIKETNTIDFIVKKLKLNAELEFSVVESKVDTGKLLPSASISTLNLDLDFDFTISGTIIATITSYFKDKIKSLIIEKIQTELKDTIIEKSKIYLTDFVSNQTVYYNLTNSGIVLDYSLVSAPIVKDGNIIVNSYGAVINKNSIANIYSPENLSKMEISTTNSYKSIQVVLTENSINTALNTLFTSGMLKYSIDTDDSFFENSALKLDTTTLDIFFYNLSKVYGKDKKINNSCNITSAPFVNLVKENFNVTISSQCDLKVELEKEDNKYYDIVMRYNFSAYIDADFKLQPNGILNAKINFLTVDNSTMTENNLPGADIQYLEQFLDFTTDLILPFLNNKFLNEININLPQFEVFSIEDSAADIEDNQIQIGINPTISNKLVDNVFYFIDNSIADKNRLFSKTIPFEKILKFLS